ncbi:MAG TPA: chromosome segregation protein SMC [Elusimicrobiales bacterium]|nr:chromosome segregation protein SMC [Elusimicrobiales bacterium]
MKLKHIEMTGFKSFADKTRLEFDSPITCVVGPNGCGKSNVIDSVRWCIGEMSWKSLRSPSMVDIIFNGTAKRSPLNMAEVNMVFDNTSKKLPIDFSEVTVTRKIYRSGESEYFLNKVQCRLRDIRDLFLDTGIGSDGYAIIDQGGVNFILEANPIERRELFEEAAGVSKYKAKRDEAIRKLEKVDIDLVRLTDTTTLINEQIKKLDSEARKARLYKRYKDELKDSEIAIAVKNLSETEQKQTSQQAQLKPLLENISNTEISLSKLEGELAALNLNLTHKRAELAKFNESIANTKYQVGKLEGDIANFENLTTELKSQIEHFNSEDQADGKRKEELTPILEKLTGEVKEFDKKMEPVSASYDETLSGIKDAENKLSQLNQNIENLNNELVNLSQQELESSKQIAFEQSAIGHIRENLINLQKEFDQKTQHVGEIKKEVSEIEQNFNSQKKIIEELKDKITQLENKKEELLANKLELEEKILELKNANAGLNAALEMTINRHGKDPYWLGTREVINSSIDGVLSTFRKEIKVASEDKIHIEEIFGHFLDAVVCRTETSAHRAIEILKSKGNMRARFIILDALSQLDADTLPLDERSSDIKSRLKYPGYLENLIHYLIAQPQFKTSQGKFLLSGGAENVSISQDDWNKEEELKKDIKLNIAQQAEVKNSLDLTVNEIKSIESEISNIKEKHSEQLISENTLLNNLKSKKENLSLAEEAITLISSEKQGFIKQQEQKEQNLTQLKDTLSQSAEQQTQKKTDIENLKTQRNELRENLAKLRLELETLSANLHIIRTQRGDILLDLKSLQMQNNTISEAIEKRAAQRITSENRIKEFGEKKLSCLANLDTQRSSLGETEVKQTELNEGLISLKLEYDAKAGETEEQKSEKSTLELKANEFEMEIKNLQKHAEEINQNLTENWQMDVTEAKMKYRDFKVDYDRVKMMRRRLENMGAVNMTAPEEYDALSSKHNFLTRQISDLDTAKSDLKSAITKINSATRENFRHTFDKVKENFQKIYQILFEGGQADIILTDPENLLETGIEIVTRPPGKRAQNISALSGGEQALTALSLLFSFFIVNPSPFCILDEADAPLDEANIDRFVNLIREFVKNTQFIVVTHNKRTMEAANVLYGITMQESGVSKVVSVELSKKGDLEGLPEAVAAA